MLLILVGILLMQAATSTSLRSHNYWFNKQNPQEKGDDYSWDYCDLKCLYLEHYSEDKDFVVLVFSALFRDTFAACYVKSPDGYTLWNKVIVNTFYEKHCGQDEKDWAAMK